MDQNFSAKAEYFYKYRQLFQNSPLRNSEKILSLRTLRLCGEITLNQK